ncbi:sensor histidine kinase [Alienimonas chondri]|uniref:histidine kinase n=1 Tax=Alienimonas chondri TaxID=2681879 RepID=A0ABX1VDF8_9PLAN|nr:HAMP domain-containing sensor histidine kinase [Alienimonas chondri]NNJ25950.1 Signal transduction histidine-protein kinase AtoS [Alienimonas chondri]
MTDDFETRLRDAKLAAMAEFCAGAGHEINNPAAAIHGRCSLLLRNCDDPALARELRVISDQSLRIRDMIADALLFARPPEPRPEPVWLGEVVEEALPGLRERAADADCTIETDLAAVALNADPEQLAVVAASLGRNAIEAGANRVRFRVRHRAGRAILWIGDDGDGFTEQERKHAFDPFFSGRQAGRGLGFGLPKCWRIVTLHAGTLDVRSFPGRTVFRASLPALAADAVGPLAAPE